MIKLISTTQKSNPQKETFQEKYKGDNLSDIYHYEITEQDKLKDLFRSIGNSYSESKNIINKLNSERENLK